MYHHPPSNEVEGAGGISPSFLQWVGGAGGASPSLPPMRLGGYPPSSLHWGGGDRCHITSLSPLKLVEHMISHHPSFNGLGSLVESPYLLQPLEVQLEID